MGFHLILETDYRGNVSNFKSCRACYDDKEFRIYQLYNSLKMCYI